MGKFLLAFLLLSTNSFADIQVALVAGMPDQSLDFVHVRGKTNFIPDVDAEGEYTTALYSILSKHKVSEIYQLVAVRHDFSIETEHLMSALEEGSALAPVVLNLDGPETVEQCGLMLMHSDTVFVLPASGETKEVPVIAPSCEARNIVRVAALNEAGDNLATFSNYGMQTVYIAAKGENVPAIKWGGLNTLVSSTGVAATSVAAELGKYAIENMDIILKNGASALVESFFNEHTEQLPAIVDRIRDGRILKRSLDF